MFPYTPQLLHLSEVHMVAYHANARSVSSSPLFRTRRNAWHYPHFQAHWCQSHRARERET